MAKEIQLSIGDPTNPDPIKQVRKGSQEVQLSVGNALDDINNSTLETEHDSYLPNGNKGSQYDNNYTNSQENQQDTRARNQPWGDKAANSLVKATGIAATGLVGTFGSLPYGIGASISNIQAKRKAGEPIDLQDFKPLVDNPIQNKISEFNDYLEQKLPDYASREEEDSAAISTTNLLSPNFLFDKIIKNAGFTVGAIGSGKIVGSLLQDASKLIASGALGAEKVAELESLLAQGAELPQALNKVASTLRVGQHFSNAIATGVMAAGEAQFEGADMKKSMKESLMQDFVAKNNRQPLPFEEAEIDKRATAAGVVDFAVNLPILGLSDFIQFGNSLTKGFKTEASAFSQQAARRIERGLGPSAFEKSLSRVGAFGKGIVTEGFEEGAQTATQKAAQNYYTRKNDLSAKDGIHDILNSTLYGVTELLGSKEGIESMLLGAITGLGSHVAMGAFNDELKEDWNAVDHTYEQTADLMKRMKQHAEDSGLQAKLDGAVRGQSIQEGMNYAVQTGNNYDFQSLKHDRWKNMVQTYTEAGKLDKLYSMLDNLKSLDKTQFLEQFPDANLETKSITQLVDERKAEVKRIAQIWDNVQTRFSTASKEQREQLWSNLSDTDNRLKREKELDLKITGLSDPSVQNPRLIPPYAALFEKYALDDPSTASQKAREEYRDLATKYLTDNSASDFDEKDVEEMFKLQDDRASLVEQYQAMKQGKGFVKEKSTTIPQSTETEEESNTDESSDEVEDTEQPTPKAKKEKQPKANKTQPTSKTKTGLSSLGEEFLRVRAKSEKARSEGKSMKNALTPEEFNTLRRMTFAGGEQQTDKGDLDVLGEADSLYNKYKNENKLDELDALLNGEAESDDEVKEPKEDPNKELLPNFYKLFKSTWEGAKTLFNKKGILARTKEGTVKYLAELQPAINDLIEKGKTIAGLNIGQSVKDKIAKNLEELEALINKAKEETATIVPTTAPKVDSSKQDPETNLKATRVIVDVDDQSKPGKISSSDLRERLSAQVDGTMNIDPKLSLSPTMEASVEYVPAPKGGREQYNIYVGTAGNKIKVGYLSQIDQNENQHNKSALKLNREILAAAKKNKFTTVQIQFNFGLNTIETTDRSTLAGSVFDKANIKIYQFKKANTVSTVYDMDDNSDASELNILDHIGEAFKEKGITDGYIMVTKSPDGNERYIGLRATPVDSQGFKEFNSLLKSNRKNTKEQLNKKFWLAANTAKGKQDFDLRFENGENGQINIAVSLNKGGGEVVARLAIEQGRQFRNIDDLISTLTFIGEKDAYFTKDKLGIDTIKELFGREALRKQINPGQGSLKDYILSVDANQPWVTGVQVISHNESTPVPVKKSKVKKSKEIQPPLQLADLVDEEPSEEEILAQMASRDSVEEDPSLLFGEDQTDDELPSIEANPDDFDRPNATSNNFDINSLEFKSDSGIGSYGLSPEDYINKYGREAYATYFQGIPFKLNSGDETIQTNFAKVSERLAKILPKGISIESIEKLLNGINANNQVWAAYSRNVIYLANAMGRGTEYHEAFHAVFRSAFMQAERDHMLGLISPLVDTSEQAISQFRTLHPSYQALSDNEVVIRIKEESLADMFQNYSVTRDDSNPIIQALKSAFNWLKSLLGFVKGHQDQLNDIFSTIYQGGFRNRTAQDTQDEVVFKTLPTLSAANSRDLVRTIIVNMFNKGVEYDKPAIMDLIKQIVNRADLNIGTQRYSKDIHYQLAVEKKGFVRKVNGVDMYLPAIFADKHLPVIYDEVISTIKGFKAEYDPDKVTGEFEDDEDKFIKEIAFDDDPFEVTMFSNVPEVIKNFLLGIGLQENNEDLLIPISVLGTHAQLKRMLVGKLTFEDMVNEIEVYKNSNPELTAVYDQLTDGLKDDYFKAAFRNAYLNEYADSRHTSINTDTLEFRNYASNRQDEGQIALNDIKKDFEAVTSRVGRIALKQLAKDALKEISAVNKARAAKSDINIQPLQQALYSVGLTLTPSMLEQVVKNKQPLDANTLYYYAHADTKNNFTFYEDIKYILDAIEKGENPFSDSDDEGMLNRLYRLASVNAKHRNDIFQTSFRNSQGKLVQSYIKPSFTFVKARELTQGKQNLLDSKYEGNFLVDLAKEVLGDQFRNKLPTPMSVFGGARETRKDEGVTAKLIDSKSKLIVNMINYADGFINPFVYESKSTESQVDLNKLYSKLKTKEGIGGINYDDFVEPGVQTDPTKFNELNQLALDSYNYMVRRNMGYIEEVINELEDPSFKPIEDVHWKVKGNKEAYINNKPNVIKAIDIKSVKEIPNGMKLLQFPRLQAKAEQIFEAQENKDWLAALDEATKEGEELDQFLQDQHQDMVREYKELLTREGVNIGKEYPLLMGNRQGVYKDNINLFLSDYVAGNFIFIDSYTNLIRGNEAKYLGPIDITKRAAGLVANGNSIHPGSTKFIMEADRITSYDPQVEGVASTDDVNNSDAQSTSSPEWYIDILKGLGKLNTKSESILRQMAEGKPVTKQEMKDILGLGKNKSDYAPTGVFKMVGFDGDVYWKTSVFALFPMMTSELNPETGLYDGTIPKRGFEELNQLRLRMKSTGHDIHAFESAIKIGRRDKQFYNPEEGYQFNSTNGFVMNNDYIRLQVENPGGKEKITFGTQLQQLIDSEMQETDDQGNPIMITNGDSMIGVKEARERVQTLQSQLTQNTMDKLNNLLDQSIEKPNGQGVESLGTSLFAEQSKANGSSESEQDWYKQDAQGNRILNQNAPSKYESFIQQVMAYVSKNVLSKKVPGLKMTLRSPVGFTNPVTKEALQIHRYINENGVEKISYAEGLISEEILWQNGLTQVTDPKTGEYQLFADDDESKTPLKQEQVDKILSMLGFRIPTQSHHSMIPFKVVGFLPASYTSTIVIPAEVAHLAGSDYDVDSLFVNRKAFYVNKQGQVIIYGDYAKIQPGDSDTIKKTKLKYQYEEYVKTETKSKAFKFIDKKLKKYNPELTEEQRETQIFKLLGLPTTFKEWGKKGMPQSSYAMTNEMLDLYLGFMTNPANRESIFTPASMTSIKQVGDLVNQLYEVSEASPLPYNSPANLHRHWAANRSNIVGPSANAAKVSAFLNKNRVLLKTPFSIGSFTSQGYADNYEHDINLTDKKKSLVRRKADSLSALVSAMTDNAKERLAIKLNLTVDTIANFGHLLALGFGMNRTMMFANQPILRALARKISAGKAHITPDQDRWDIPKIMLKSLSGVLGADNIPESLEFTDDELISTVNLKSQELLKKYNKVASPENEEDTKFLQLQYKILAKYIQLEELTNYFNTANRLLNTNKGAGITGEELDRLLEDEVKFSPKNEEKPFDFPLQAKSILTNLRVINGDRYTKEDDSSLRGRLAAEFLTRAKPAMEIQRNLVRYGRMSRKMLKDLKRGYLASLTVAGINEDLKTSDKGMPKSLEEYEYLISESSDNEGTRWYQKNIVDQYNYIREKYAKANSALSRNIAFNALVPKSGNKENPFFRLEFNTNMKIDTQYKEDLMSSMLDLMRYGEGTSNENGEVMQFAQNLYYMVAIKDALQFRNNSPISLFPPMRFAKISRFLERVQQSIDEPKELAKVLGKPNFQFEKEFLTKWLQNPSNRRRTSWEPISSLLEDYQNSDKTELRFKPKEIESDEWERIFGNFASLIKNEKTGYVDWPLLLKSGDDFYIKKWFNPETLEVEYEKVNTGNYNPQHSAYSIPVNFKTAKAVKSNSNQPSSDENDSDNQEPEEEPQDELTDSPDDDPSFLEPEEIDEQEMIKQMQAAKKSAKQIQSKEEEEPNFEDEEPNEDDILEQMRACGKA